MGRSKSIDREQVLQAAEALVAEHGSGALTISAVASAAGISKGGVQSCFGSKEALIAAMLARWMASYEERFAAVAAADDIPVERIAAHVAVTRADDVGSQTRAAGLLAMLIQEPIHLAETRDWYRRRIAGLNMAVPEQRKALQAFLAAEGAFFLRFLGLLPMDQVMWSAIFDEIGESLEPVIAT